MLFNHFDAAEISVQSYGGDLFLGFPPALVER